MAKYIKTEEGYKDLEESVSKIVDPVNAELSNKMNKTNPTGTGSFSLNRKAGTIEGANSFVCGSRNTASGDTSHAEGYSTKASGNDSHAEGYSTTASGYSSHAEGSVTTASGSCSHAEGNGSVARDSCDHAEGFATIASGGCSHAEGYETIASSNNQHVQGKFNIEDTSGTYAHIVGNGTSYTSCSNAHTLDWKGNAWYQGDVYVGGTNQTTGSKKLATEEYVDEAVPDLSGFATKDEIPEQVQSDWNQSDTYSKDYIKNRPFYINETLQTETELTLTNGEGTVYVSFGNMEAQTSSTVRDVHVVMKRNSEIVFDLTGTANYTGNPIYDWGFASLTGTCSLMPGRDVSCKYIDRDWSITVDGQDVSRLNGVYTVYCYSLEINKISDIFIPDTIARTSQITVPDKLPNPNALTLTGAVNATYDGSQAVSVEIPSGGSGGGEDPAIVYDTVLTEEVGLVEITEDRNGNPFNLKSLAIVCIAVGTSSNTQNGYGNIYINGDKFLSSQDNFTRQSGVTRTNLTLSIYNKYFRVTSVHYKDKNVVNENGYFDCNLPVAMNFVNNNSIYRIIGFTNEQSNIAQSFKIKCDQNTVFGVGSRIIIYDLG